MCFCLLYCRNMMIVHQHSSFALRLYQQTACYSISSAIPILHADQLAVTLKCAIVENWIYDCITALTWQKLFSVWSLFQHALKDQRANCQSAKRVYAATRLLRDRVCFCLKFSNLSFYCSHLHTLLYHCLKLNEIGDFLSKMSLYILCFLHALPPWSVEAAAKIFFKKYYYNSYHYYISAKF